MHRFWNSLIQPILTLSEPKSIVEVGAAHGQHTKKLLDFAKDNDCMVHVVDPNPAMNVETFQQENPHHLQFHRSVSLEPLPEINNLELVLLDGDHNWFTVYHELKLLDTLTQQRKHAFPMVLLHDIAWPYARRDMYYEPETIPVEYRQPYAFKGIRRNSVDLVDSGPSLNAHLANAVSEGGPRNGVLTGIEDFLKETSQDLDFVQIHAIWGFGLIFPRKLLESKQILADFISHLRLSEPVANILRDVEMQRVASAIERQGLFQEIREIRRLPMLVRLLLRKLPFRNE